MWANVGVEEMIHHVVGGKDDADRHGREKEKGWKVRQNVCLNFWLAEGFHATFFFSFHANLFHFLPVRPRDPPQMRISNILSRYSELKEANIPTLTNQHSYKVSQFHKMLKNTYGKSLAKLQVLQNFLFPSPHNF